VDSAIATKLSHTRGTWADRILRCAIASPQLQLLFALLDSLLDALLSLLLDALLSGLLDSCVRLAVGFVYIELAGARSPSFLSLALNSRN
jgi:hypothetical protein